MSTQPLPERIRPKDFIHYVGQEHLIGSTGSVTHLLDKEKDSGFFPSLIFWGPPGSGKTTLARLIARQLQRPIEEFSAVNASIKEIEKAVQRHQLPTPQTGLFTENRSVAGRSPLIFIDEIHRFNKSQQDALLPLVEQGHIILLGATTENPSFEVISPLLSRCRVVVLNRLSDEELTKIINRGAEGLSSKLAANLTKHLAASSNGDARIALNTLEIAHYLAGGGPITEAILKEALQSPYLSFDLKGEEYYNTISALHKSIRGSDPNASIYYLARMLEAGQDPLYIARRLIRCAAEDIGLADWRALLVANAAFEACDKIGLPECNIILAEAVVYLAKAPKSNELYVGYGKAAEDVKVYANLPVPLHIRNAPTKLMEELGYGKNYDYHHDPEGKKKEGVEYLPDKLRGHRYLFS